MDTGDDGEGESSNEGWESRREKRRRRRKKRVKHSLTVVNPDSDFYYCWLLLVTASVLYNLWTLIVRQSFPELQAASPAAWFTADTLTDITFYLDVVVQFRTGYLEQGLMVYNSRKLTSHYVKSKEFALDVVSITPLEYIYPLFVTNPSDKPILRFPRFLKVYRLYQFYYFAEARTIYPNVYRVVNLIHILLLLAHWFGCFYFLISEAGGFKGYWAYPLSPGAYETLTRKYLGSLYWSTLTLTTIGDLPTPETNVEYIFTIVSYLIGVFIFATIVGQVGNVITNRNANRLEFERLLDGAKTYMRHHKVPGGMKRRVLRWYDYSWSRGRIQGGGDINTALGLLPDKLKTELALHVNLSVLKKVTIFQECQPEFLHDLVLKMKAYIFTPGDLICRKGEVAREMFIIADGILEVISETGRVMTTMQSGDFFGEIGILNLDGLNKRTADVRSVGYSELFSLSREDVLTAMKDYPEAQEILQNLGRKRLMEARNMNKQFKNGQKKKDAPQSPPSLKSDKVATDTKNIVEKIRFDVKNAFKISRKCSRGKSDSLELVPLTKASSDVKSGSVQRGTLCRMSRIYNDNNSVEDDPPKLGAGLPLLQRLKLLKEKQEQTKKEPDKPAVPPAKPITEEKGNPMDQSLPLLQRIKLLKQKEEAEKNALHNVASTSQTSQQSTVRTQLKSPFTNTLKVTNSNESKALAAERNSSFKSIDTAKEKIKNDTIETVVGDSNDIEKWKKLQKATVVSDLRGKSEELANSADGATNLGIKKGPVCFKSDATVKTFDVDEVNDLNNDSNTVYDKESINRQNLFEGKRRVPSHSKTYRSIDDLSPEYAGLPFVKKLKILNERQKLAELEKDLAVRSSSLDSGGDIAEVMASFNPSELTRSISEAVAIEVVIRNQQNRDSTLDSKSDTDIDDNLLVSPPGSPESNETVERRKLKSILKNLSSGSTPSPYSSSISLPPAHPQFKQLIRAQTVEGYVARHSKLTKCVTFSQVDIATPPVSPMFHRIEEEKPNQSPFDQINLESQEVTTGLDQTLTHSELPSTLEAKNEEILEKEGIDEPSPTQESYSESPPTNPPKEIYPETRASSIILENEIGDIVGTIETAVQDQIDAIKIKYEDQFATLTSEILKRDKLIAELRLELLQMRQRSFSMEDDFSDQDSDSKLPHPFMRDESVVTVLSSDGIEGFKSSTPQLPRSINFSLDMGSDTDNSSDDDDEPPYDNQWEFKLLAEELEKREASLFKNSLSSQQLIPDRLIELKYGLSQSSKTLGEIMARSDSLGLKTRNKLPFLRTCSLPQSGTSASASTVPMAVMGQKMESSDSPGHSDPDLYYSDDSFL